MSAIRRQICPCCSQPKTEYKQGLSLGIVRALFEAYRLHRCRPFKPGDEETLDHGQKNNWQKLRYWGLVVKDPRAAGQEKSGWWRVTALGEDFLVRGTRVTRFVWTYRGEVMEIDHGTLVTAVDVWDGYRRPHQWAEEARDRDRPDQGELNLTT